MDVIDGWMIYGANGYTGELIAREAQRRGQQPVLAGRNESAVLALASELDLPYRHFPLDSAHQCKPHLEGVGIVLNCAGPFSQTAEVLREACLAAGCHYLDITGEMAILRSSYELHARAREKGIVVISGVGFDVVPTDVLALKLKERLPSATHLQLAFAGGGGISPGTAKTMVEMMPERGKIRRQGEVTSVALAYDSKDIPFFDRSRHAMTIPWGDVETAYYSTGIGNIQVYTAVEPAQAKWMRRMNPLAGVLGIGFLQRGLQKLIGKKLSGPNAEQRAQGYMQLWGLVSDGTQTLSMTMQTSDGYDFTVKSALLFVDELLAHKILPGAYTPSQAVDPQHVLDLEGVALQDA
jgi:short subunit dehydrogenase-like uncharacterized protein